MKLALCQIHVFFIVLALFRVCTLLPAQSLSKEERSIDSISGDAFTRNVSQRALDYTGRRLIEKVYLHFDKPYYAAGSVCWYRAFVVNALDLLPTQQSQVLYVDWISPDGQLIKHQLLNIVDGEAYGDYVLSEDLPEGIYTARAYTQWMRNEDQDFFFYTSFSVFNPSTVPGQEAKAMDPLSVDLQFFPEGGVMVTGLQSQVAFRAIDMHGKGVAVRGEIFDELNNYVTSFESLHKGMGVFTFTPVKKKTYSAKLVTGKIIDLPAAYDSGFVMSVSNRSSKSLVVRIQGSTGSVQTDFYLIGQSRGQVCFHGKFTLGHDFINVEIPKQPLPAGVMQLTLFDLNGIPCAERMVFINPQVRLNINVESDKQQYGPREPIQLNIRTADATGTPVEATLSFAVTDAGLVTREFQGQNIVTQLLMQSDMKGELENPAWYFESDNRENVFALDLVMLTHGWRKFDWEAVLDHPDEPLPFYAEQGLTLNGRVIKLENKKPLTSGGLILIAKGGGHEGLYFAETDEDGKFQILNVDFNDSTNLVWVTRNEKGKAVNSSILFAENDLPPIIIQQERSDHRTEKDEYLKKLVTRFRQTGEWNAENVKMLEEVIINASRLPDDPRAFSSLTAKGAHSYVVRPSKDIAYTDVSQMIAGQVPGVQVFGSGPNMQVRIRGPRTLMGGPNAIAPLILLDGLPLPSDPGEIYFSLNSVPVNEVERIEILTGPSAALYGARGGGGVIAIFSKIGSNVDDGEKKVPGKGIVKLYKSGYDWPRQFYQPKYELEHEKSSGVPDQRVTLYWNPSVRTDKDGNATVHFFNSDATTVFQVVVEGISNGLPGALIKNLGY